MNFFFLKISVDAWHRKLTLKVQFWHFLKNHNSSQDCSRTMSFEHVDSRAKILHFRTHHLQKFHHQSEIIFTKVLIVSMSKVQLICLNKEWENMEIEHCLKLNRKKPYKFWTLFCPIRQIWTQSLSILDGDFFNLTRYLIWLPLTNSLLHEVLSVWAWKRKQAYWSKSKAFFSSLHLKKKPW